MVRIHTPLTDNREIIMLIIRAKKLKKLINEYAVIKGTDKNEFTHIYYKAVWDARVFGLCIIRQKRLWNVFTKLLRRRVCDDE